MARLISKVVRSSTNGIDDDGYSRSWNKSHSQPNRHHHQPQNQNGSGPNTYSGDTKRGSGIISKLGNLSGKNNNLVTTVTREGSSGSDIHLATYHQQQQNQGVPTGGGITKTIETTIQAAESEYGGRESRDFGIQTPGRVFDGSPGTEGRLGHV
jgi:hypothetical protein